MKRSSLAPAVVLASVLVFNCGDNATYYLSAGFIQGKVTTTTGDTAIAGAVVRTFPPTCAVTTDAKGEYQLGYVMPDHYTITALKIGYMPGTAVISVAQGQTLVADIRLKGGSFTQGMALIPAAGHTFQMGSMNGNVIERPVHAVSFTYDFYMDTTEVTQADYGALTGYTPSRVTGDLLRPVERVNWFDAALYCNERSTLERLDTVYSYTAKQVWDEVGYQTCIVLGNIAVDFTKNGYRLPTEAEWEYACRAGTTGDFYWGGNYPPATLTDTAAIDDNAVWWHNSNNVTARVGTKLPNAFGLYDMSGNVWEWCNDNFTFYGSDSLVDPFGPGTEAGSLLRGGSDYNMDINLRSACREYHSADVLSDWLTIGFRCVKR